VAIKSQNQVADGCTTDMLWPPAWGTMHAGPSAWWEIWRQQTTSKMAAPLEACMREEQRAVIRFLGSEGEKPADIHRRMKRQYGDARVSLQQVYEWHRKFKSRVSTLTDAAHSGKLMLTLFWDYKGPILQHYIPRGLTINSESYCDLLQNHLKPAIRSKRRGLLSSGVFLQHDNACPHTARATAKKIKKICVWSVFHILHIHRISHRVIIMCLDPSRSSVRTMG
jgi:hypothetical protein